MLVLPRISKPVLVVASGLTFAGLYWLWTEPAILRSGLWSHIGDPDYSKQGWTDAMNWEPRPLTRTQKDWLPEETEMAQPDELAVLENMASETYGLVIETAAVDASKELEVLQNLASETYGLVLETASATADEFALLQHLASETYGLVVETATADSTSEAMVFAATTMPPSTSHAAIPTYTESPSSSVSGATTFDTSYTTGTSLEESTSGTSRMAAATDTSSAEHTQTSPLAGLPVSNTSHAAPCQSLTGGEEILVVMRTGATEIEDKLPVHLDTTFRCYPQSVIFSDYAETFHGHQVHDVLADIDDEVKTSNSDFEHYQHVLDVGRAGLDASELSGKASYESAATGKNENAGWRLDKWKFLPMINKTLALYPDKQWYVFVEPDSYLVWSNLLQWLPLLNHTEPLYFGSEVQIGEDVFAHGGSVFVLSHAAIVKGVEKYTAETQKWHEWTAEHWAGDCVLGRALHEAGVELTWMNPQLQGGNPALMDFGLNRESDLPLWCVPAISYHHLSVEETEAMWDFEQAWITNHTTTTPTKPTKHPRKPKPAPVPASILHHSDTFKSFVLPALTAERADWSNNDPQAADDEDYISSADLAHCRALCESVDECLQYALTPRGCTLGSEIRLGRAEEYVHSGWMLERAEKWVRGLEKCAGKGGWLHVDEGV